MKGEQGSSRLGDTSKSQDALDLEIGTALIFEGVFGFLPFSPQIQSIICVGLYSLNNIKKTIKITLTILHPFSSFTVQLLMSSKEG